MPCTSATTLATIQCSSQVQALFTPSAADAALPAFFPQPITIVITNRPASAHKWVFMCGLTPNLPALASDL